MKLYEKYSQTKRILIFLNIVLCCIASSMLSTAMTTALPKIVLDLEIEVTKGQWMTSGYSLVMAIMMPMTAYLIGRFDTKKLYCGAIIIFTVGLIISAVAISFEIMMLGRVFQAASNGVLTAMAQVITLSLFTPEKTGTAMGWYGLSVGAAPVIAPTLAGVLIDLYDWRSIFFIAIFIMVVTLIFSLITFENLMEKSTVRFDLRSFVVSAFAFGGITLGIGNIGSYGMMHYMITIPLLIGIVSAIIFVKMQLSQSTPFLNLRILKNDIYRRSVIGSMVLYFAMMGSSIIMPLYVQQLKSLSATISGIVMLPGAAAMAIISPFAGKLYDKLGVRKIFISGAIGLVLSNFAMCFITMNTSVWFACGMNCIRCIAIGCLMMPLVTWGVSQLSENDMRHGTALLTSLRTICGAIGAAVVVAILKWGSEVELLGKNNAIWGINAAYVVLMLVSILLLVIAFQCEKKKEII